MSVLPKEPLNIIIAGVGGQGNIAASQIIALAALCHGLSPTIGETYGVSQRGGSVMSHVRITSQRELGPLIPKGHADVLIGFEPLETFKVACDYANPTTKVLLNPRPLLPIGVIAGHDTYPSVEMLIQEIRRMVAEIIVVNATDMAAQAGDVRAMNIVMVGVLAALQWLPLPVDSYKESIESLFRDKAQELNIRAFMKGRTYSEPQVISPLGGTSWSL